MPVARTHIDVPDVVHQLIGDVLAALAQSLRWHLVIRVPVPISRVRIGCTGGGVVYPRGGHDAHRLP